MLKHVLEILLGFTIIGLLPFIYVYRTGKLFYGVLFVWGILVFSGIFLDIFGPMMSETYDSPGTSPLFLLAGWVAGIVICYPAYYISPKAIGKYIDKTAGKERPDKESE